MKKYLFNLKDIRKSKKLNQTELAKLVKTSQHQISRYENLREQPTLEKLVDIAMALDVTLDELIEIKKIHKKYSSKMKNL